MTSSRMQSLMESLGQVQVGNVHLRNPFMTASGTAGHGAELNSYMLLRELGAVVVKSLYHSEWAGNAAPRVHAWPQGMLNAVGLQGPGVRQWINHSLPEMLSCGATPVVSIWGRNLDDYKRAAELLMPAKDKIAAVEVNLSCPNLEGRNAIFAHDQELSEQVISSVAQFGFPVFAKLSANTDRVVAIGRAVADAGASAVTLINTMLGMHIDVKAHKPSLGNGGGGLSGPAIHPIAVRAVFDMHVSHPDIPIIGVGGVASGRDAVELLMAGASAVQVGTATFARPNATHRIMCEAAKLVSSLGYTQWSHVTGAVHRG